MKCVLGRNAFGRPNSVCAAVLIQGLLVYHRSGYSQATKQKGRMRFNLGYWWPFAQTAWGWTVATAGGLAAVFYGPKKMFETWDWYLNRFFDSKVKEFMEDNTISFAHYTPPGGGRLQSADPKAVSEIAKALGFTEKRTRRCLKRLRSKEKGMCVGGDMWKLVISHLVA